LWQLAQSARARPPSWHVRQLATVGRFTSMPARLVATAWQVSQAA
jgi:hypothetical protein